MTEFDTVTLPRLESLADSLPERRLAIRVRTSVASAIRKGHPWVYADAIEGRDANLDGIPGQLAVVFDPKGRFAGIGLFDPDSPIRVRILQAATPTPIDEAFWRERIGRAGELRRELAVANPANPDTTTTITTDTTAYRLINGEGDGFGGLVVDRYADWLSLKVYSAGWLPHLAALLPILGDQVPRATGVGLPKTVVRFARSIDHPPLCTEPPPRHVDVLESGLRFEAALLEGQKTGMFLDQRENRLRVRDLASGARVLDLFCCNGGFGVYAAAGGARQVTSVDASAPAVASTTRHMKLNRDRFARGFRHEPRTGDAMAHLGELRRAGRSFDLIVCDPPSFARNASMVPGALAAYTRLVRGCVEVLAEDGILVQASCTSRVTPEQLVDAVHTGARQTGSTLRVEAITGHAVDHPYVHEEGRYLKAVYARKR